MGKLPEANAAYAEIAEIRVRTAADFTAVIPAGRELGRSLLF